MAHLLIIEDELVLAHQLEVALQNGGHEVAVAGTVGEGLASARKCAPDLVLLDLRLPDGSGLDVIPDLLQLDAGIRVVLMTAFGSERDAVDALRRGAADYLTKPLDMGELGLLIQRLLRDRDQERELSHVRERAGDSAWRVLEASTDLRPLFTQVERLCDPSVSPAQRPPILLCAAPGDAASAVARVIHERLGGGPFLEIEASGGGAVFERRLFGVDAGGDVPSLPSLFEAAKGGALVLHGIASLAPSVVERIVETVTERSVQRAGARRRRPVQLQVIVTAGAGAEPEAIEELARSLRALVFELRPLGERPDDLRALARHFASAAGSEIWGAPSQLTPEAEEALLLREWPGNARELRAEVEAAVIRSRGEQLDEAAFRVPERPDGSPGTLILPEEGIVLEDVERDLLRQALERTRGNQTRAAGLLGVSRDTLRYRAAKLGVGVARQRS